MPSLPLGEDCYISSSPPPLSHSQCCDTGSLAGCSRGHRRGTPNQPQGPGAPGGPRELGFGYRKVLVQRPLPACAQELGSTGQPWPSATVPGSGLGPGTVPRQGAYPQWVLTFVLAHIHSYGDNSEPPPSHFPLTAPPDSKPLSF